MSSAWVVQAVAVRVAHRATRAEEARQNKRGRKVVGKSIQLHSPREFHQFSLDCGEKVLINFIELQEESPVNSFACRKCPQIAWNVLKNCPFLLNLFLTLKKSVATRERGCRKLMKSA